MQLRLILLCGLVVLSVQGQAYLRAQGRPVYPISQVSATSRVVQTTNGNQALLDQGIPPKIPLEAVPATIRDKVRAVMDRPSLSSKAQPETFQAEGHVYRWLLEHPDMTVKLWKQIGARVQDIHDRGDGVYVWKDDQGSEVKWHSALKAAGLHMWYAEGKVKPGAVMPLTSFKAVAILVYHEGKDVIGKTAIRHQVHFMLRCDSRAVAVAARILGASAPRMAEQYLGQLQMFYGGMAWYLKQDEERARTMYRRIGLIVPETPPVSPVRMLP